MKKKKDSVLKDIVQQFYEYGCYVRSIRQANSTCGEHSHPKTGERITCAMMYDLLSKDAERRAKKIIKNYLTKK